MYAILKGHWCDVILNVRALTDDKSDDAKNSSYEELRYVFNQFLVYHIIFWRFQCKRRERRYFKTDRWELEFT